MSIELIATSRRSARIKNVVILGRASFPCCGAPPLETRAICRRHFAPFPGASGIPYLTATRSQREIGATETITPTDCLTRSWLCRAPGAPGVSRISSQSSVLRLPRYGDIGTALRNDVGDFFAALRRPIGVERTSSARCHCRGDPVRCLAHCVLVIACRRDESRCVGAPTGRPALTSACRSHDEPEAFRAARHSSWDGRKLIPGSRSGAM